MAVVAAAAWGAFLLEGHLVPWAAVAGVRGMALPPNESKLRRSGVAADAEEDLEG